MLLVSVSSTTTVFVVVMPIAFVQKQEAGERVSEDVSQSGLGPKFPAQQILRPGTPLPTSDQYRWGP